MAVIEPPVAWNGEPAVSTKYILERKRHLVYQIMKGSSLL